MIFFQQKFNPYLELTVAPGSYGVGNIFFPQDTKERQHCISIIEKTIKDEGQSLIGWRDVPLDEIKADIGDTASESQPVMKQLIIANSQELNSNSFEACSLYYSKTCIQSYTIR